MNFSQMSLGQLFETASEIGSKYQDIDSISLYEYRLTVANEDKDTENLTAVFDHSPSFQDWQEWLSGWSACSYTLTSVPALIRVT